MMRSPHSAIRYALKYEAIRTFRATSPKATTTMCAKSASQCMLTFPHLSHSSDIQGVPVG